MKSSCIKHPAGEPLIIIRRWQIKACDGNACAAALLSFFEYWHNVRLDSAGRSAQANAVAEKLGEPATQDASLIQYHTTAQLEQGIMLYSSDAIRAGIALLEDLGFVSCHKNPNPRLAFDRTRHFKFHPDAAQEWLDANESALPEKRTTRPENRRPSPEIPPPSPEKPESSNEEPKEEPDKKGASAPSAAEPKASAHLAFINAWGDAYLEAFGDPYIFAGGKDGSAVKRLLKAGLPSEELLVIARAAWSRSHLFNCKQAASIAGFASRLNDIRAELRGAKPKASDLAGWEEEVNGAKP